MRRLLIAGVAMFALALSPFGLSAADAVRLKYVTSVYLDDKGVGLNLPEGVACGAGGQVVVADTGNDRLVRFTLRDKTVSGGSVIKVPQLAAPFRVQVSPAGAIYVLDRKQRRIVTIGQDGQFKGVLAIDGAPAPATVVPKSFVVDATGRIAVLDVYAGRVLVLTPQGAFQKALALPADTGFGADLTVDSDGTIVLLDSLRRTLFAAGKDATSFSPLGGPQRALQTLPSGLVAVKGIIFVGEGPGSSVVAIGRNGAFLTRQLGLGWEEGGLNYPSQMCVTDQDEVLIADRDNSRLQVYQLVR